MDRKRFLELCQRISILPNDVSGVKQGITDNLTVNFDSMTFYPVAYQMSFENGKQKNIAILHDLKCASVLLCDLEKVSYEED